MINPDLWRSVLEHRCAGRLAEAERCCRLLLDANPGNAEAHAELGVICMDMAKWQEAELVYRRALQLAPGAAELRYNLGNALRDQGRVAEAGRSVPVVTLAGGTATSRRGASLLHAVGLSDLVAHGPEKYVEIAAGLAHDRDRLAKLRMELRARMARSPLTDSARFTANL